jgi:hypothetical protein
MERQQVRFRPAQVFGCATDRCNCLGASRPTALAHLLACPHVYLSDRPSHHPRSVMVAAESAGPVSFEDAQKHRIPLA